MSGGIRYTVQVPEFIKEERSPDEVVVTYQVDILVQVPGSSETRPPTSQWRRFSEFRQLYTNLKRAFPEIFNLKLMEPPPKKNFRFVNNNDKLLEERRVRLEQWLWTLLQYHKVAQSMEMRVFLQLDLAIRAANMGFQSQSSIGRGSLESGYAEERSEPDTDAMSEISAQSGITSFSQTNTDILSLRSPRTYVGDHMDPLRMGLRMEHRPELGKLVAKLSAYIEKASLDFQEVATECKQLKQANIELNGKLQSLSGSADAMDAEQKDAVVADLEMKLRENAVQLEDSKKRVNELEEIVEDQMQMLASPSQSNGSAVDGDGGVADLRNQIEILTKENSDLQNQLTAGKQKFQQDNRLLAGEIARLRTANERLEAEASDFEKQKTVKVGIEATLAAAETEKRNHLLKLTELEELLNQQNGELEALKSASLAVSGEKEARDSEVANLESVCEGLKLEKEKLVEEKKEMDVKLNTAVQQTKVLQENLARVGQEHEAKCSELKEHCSVFETRAGAAEVLKTEVEKLKSEVLKLEENLGLVTSERNGLKEEVCGHHEVQERMVALEEQLGSLSRDNSRLEDERGSIVELRESLASTTAKAEELTAEVEQLNQEKASISVEKEEALVRSTSLVTEIDSLRQSAKFAAEQTAQVEKLNAEKELLVNKSVEQDRVLTTQVNDLLAQVKQLTSENQALGGLRVEIEELKKEKEAWGHKIEQENSHRDSQLREKEEALQRTLKDVLNVKEALHHAEEGRREAEQELVQLQAKVGDMEAKLLKSNSEVNGSDEFSLAHVAEVLRLQSELETLRGENEALKKAPQKTEESSVEGQVPPGTVDLVTVIRNDVMECTKSVPTLSGQTPLNPDVVTDLMDKLAWSNGQLEGIATRASELRSLVTASTSSADLGGAVADVVIDLVNKCREMNEMRVDQYLQRVEVSSTPVTPPSQTSNRRSGIQRTRANSMGSVVPPETNQGMRGMLSRISGSSSQSPEQDRTSEGDSKVKRIFGGVGSKISSGSQGFMKFMQGGTNLQANLLETPSNDSSLPESSSNRGGQRS